ncbi:glycosyltransferase family 9 protein [Calditrichota bacterium]
MAPSSNILILRNDRLGDVILTLPVVPALHKRHPDARIHFLTSHAVAPLLHQIDGIDKVIPSEADDARSVISELKSLQIDSAYCLRPTYANAIALKRANIPHQVGTSRRWYSYLFNKRVNVSRKFSGSHEADLNLITCGFDKDVSEYPFPKVRQSDDVIRNTKELLLKEKLVPDQKYFIVHPGSGGSARDWSVNYFRDFAIGFSKQTNWQCVVTGSVSEVKKVSAVAGEKFVNLAGKTDLLTLTALLGQARFAISNSTGPLHLAHLLGTKVLGLYPPVPNCTPDRWGPYRAPESAMMPNLPMCSQCTPSKSSLCTCMEQLTVEEVLDRACQLIEDE